MAKDHRQPAPAPHPRAAAALAKLSLPRLAQGIPRPRLFAALDEARSRPLVWMAAPAGAGKTTLAAGYVLERRLPYLWYQLDRDDADPATFFYYLGIAARQRLPGEEIHLPLLTAEYLPDLFGFARRYFRTLFARLPHGAVLVLDNFQDLGEAPLLEAILLNAIAEMPVHGNLLMLSREEPPRTLFERTGSDRVALLNWDELRLRMDETAAIAAQSHGLDDRALRSLHRRADGWPAGVTLLLEQMQRSMGDARSLEGGSPDTIFQFFAREFFNHLPDATRDFLLTTAVLVHMTPAMAEEVSGNADAAGILDDLHRRRFFIHRRDLEERSYQYHALFREFLLAGARERYAQEAYTALIRRAAGVLKHGGRHEEAVALLLQARDWENAAALLLETAPGLLGQGRAQIISDWLQQMPDDIVQSAPWLLYWKGASQAFADPGAAQADLERAYRRFIETGDVLGQMLAASGMIDIIFFLRDSLFRAAPWADALQGLLSSEPMALPPAVEAQLLSSLVAIAELLRPNDPRLPRHAERLFQLLGAAIDDNQKALIAPRLIIYHAVISGDAAACDAVMRIADSIIARPQVSEGSRINWKLLSVLPAIYLGLKGQANAALHTLIEFVRDGNLERNLREHNLLHLHFVASWYAALVYLAQEDFPAADGLLEGMARALDKTESIDAAIYAMIRAMHALGRGDLAAARRFGVLSLRAHNSQGAMITGLDVYCLLALERCARGAFEEALRLLATPKDYGTHATPCLNYQVYLTEAFVCFSMEDAERCHDRLRRALSVARQHRFLGFRFWLSRVMPTLLAEALWAGIEPGLVRDIIRAQGVTAPNFAPHDWPWPVRIRALGPLRVEVHDRELPVSQGGKPLALLALLIANGGREVRIEQLAEQLWPDSEGDTGLSAFTTTISRLRKLIGEEAVVVQGGRVNLDQRQCWLDVWALEHWLDRSQRREASEIGSTRSEEAISQLYLGPFLPSEEAAWASLMRQRLRENMTRWMHQRAGRLSAAGKTRSADSLLRRLAAADPALTADQAHSRS